MTIASDTKTYNATQTAKFLRQALKASFPGQKFSVRSSDNSITVEWTNGVAPSLVKEMTKQFAGIKFDGMEDRNCYSRQMFNGEEVQFYCYQPTVRRDLTNEFAQKLLDKLLPQTGILTKIKVAGLPDNAWFSVDSPSGYEYLDPSDNHHLMQLVNSTSEADLIQEVDLYQIDLDEVIATRAKAQPTTTKEENLMTIIHSYTRQDAIEDGGQFLATGELAQIVADAGFKLPVYYTAAVDALIQRAVDNPDAHNDKNGIFHDLMQMAFSAVKYNRNSSRIEFECIITGAGQRKCYEFILQIGATDIDNPAPALTLMLPEDD